MADNQLVYHLEGDDHEDRAIWADSEADAREQCAEGFNNQYGCDCDGVGDDHTEDCGRGTYEGDEFTLLGVYRVVGDDASPGDDFECIRDELERVADWPKV
ncbi:hypothetical protein [Gordonia sihwensis]|uniref:hypothetical protein n=1 Tax=Gordonia sihwensis TaxID=173559 RepID=UPI003D969ABF